VNNIVRHPIYFVVCLLSTVYLGVANSRGWSLGHAMGVPFGRTMSSTRTFNHK
jgi:hypothetical protein